MTRITIKTIAADKTTDGQPMPIEADADGHIYIDGKQHERIDVRDEAFYLHPPMPGMPTRVAAWKWHNTGRLPAHTKIAFTADEIATARAHAASAIAQHEAKLAAVNASIRERRRLEREWDVIHNEGADGYNPYRSDSLSGTAFDRRERHYPEGA